MWRKLTVWLMCLVLCWTTVACGSTNTSTSNNQNPTVLTSNTNQVSGGQYEVQQATYNDATGEYTILLLNTPSGQSSVYTTTDLQMARLTDEEIEAGQKTYLEVQDADSAVMHLTEDFKIEYVHNVTETQTDPQTGQTQTVVVRRESGFWSPFAGALAGQALGSLLFRPQYYVPPVYQPGGVITGYGGYGSTYNQAVDRYQTRYNQPPAAVRNRQTLRTTGRIRNSNTRTSTNTRNTKTNTRSTGSGVGSSTFDSSNKRTTTGRRQPSFGSNTRRRTPTRSYRRSGGFRRR